MESKNKKYGLIAGCIIIAIASGAASFFLGTFSGVTDILLSLKLKSSVILKLLSMIAFIIAINILTTIVLDRIPQKTARTQTLLTVAKSVSKYAFAVLGVCWGLTIMGVNVSTVIASVGVVALIIGFGAESLVADLVTGFFILFEGQYNVGDYVELDGYRGTVEFMGIRTTGIRDAGGNIKIVNNSDIKNIVNRSANASVAVSTIGISYALNLEEVEKAIPEILEKIKKNNPAIFTGEIKYLGVEELADSAVVLKFCAECQEKDIFSGRRILNRELKVLFDKYNFEIAYPQLDVHMR